MKKVLFATTALVATAGMAAAEVSFGGFGRFGLYHQENATGNDETRIEQRFRLTITGQTTSDNGLEFEGRIRFQTDENGSGASSVAKSSAAGFAVSTGGFRLDVGSVSNVIDSGDVVNYFGYGVGLTSFAEQSSEFSNTAVGFGTKGSDLDTVAPTVKLRYTVGDFTVSASVTDDADTIAVDPATNVLTTTTGNSSYQIGAGYSFGNYAVGAVFGSTENTGPGGSDNDEWLLGFTGDIGALAFAIIVGDSDAQSDVSYGFSVKYDVGAATEIRFVFSDSGAPGNSDTIALGFRHSLGGGVSLQGGIGDDQGTTKADLGVIFNF
ncbi:porin [Tateyamaria armeniaca]|uniref:Porin n=1 Tax=Tateyamaria armeniaca TaxID=2518930 RepID=A0ABW8USB2_9RHOB